MFIYCIHRSGQQYSKLYSTALCTVLLIKKDGCTADKLAGRELIIY